MGRIIRVANGQQDVGDIERADAGDLKPYSWGGGSVCIKPGRFVKSDGSGIANLTSEVMESDFLEPVSGPGQARYDLISIDDDGTVIVLKGTEVTAPGNPYTDAPRIAGNMLPIAIAKVDELAPEDVIVTDEDITDIRGLINKQGVPSGMVNKIINGDFSIWQRTPNAFRLAEPFYRYCGPDRFSFDMNAVQDPGSFEGVATVKRSYDVPSFDQAGRTPKN